jgi:hypothetical protein
MNHEDRAFVSRRNLLTRLSGAVSLLVVLFVVSLVALLGWIAYFVFDATFLGRRHALGGLWLTAALSGSVVLFSGLLAFHYRQEDYTQGEAVFYGVFLVISMGILLCSDLWAVLISLFG